MTKCVIEVTVENELIQLPISEAVYNALAGNDPVGFEDKVEIVIRKFDEDGEEEVAIRGVYL